MSLPANFSQPPGEELHRYFRNSCREFKKVIQSSKNINELISEMENFINTSKQMDWHYKPSGVYHKEQGQKAVDKVWSEFKRYIKALASHSREAANPQDLIDALGLVEQMIDSYKVE